MLDEEKSNQLLEIATAFSKSPNQFINDIIESTYNKLQMFKLEWDDDEQ